MDAYDQNLVAEKLREIHRLIDETFGLTDIGVVLMMDSELIQIVGMDPHDPKAERSVLPVESKNQPIVRGPAILQPQPEGYHLKLTGKTKPLVPDVVAPFHMITATADGAGFEGRGA